MLEDKVRSLTACKFVTITYHNFLQFKDCTIKFIADLLVTYLNCLVISRIYLIEVFSSAAFLDVLQAPS